VDLATLHREACLTRRREGQRDTAHSNDCVTSPTTTYQTAVRSLEIVWPSGLYLGSLYAAQQISSSFIGLGSFAGLMVGLSRYAVDDREKRRMVLQHR
jgi:hypothetical protein